MAKFMGTLTGQGVEMFHCKIDIQITQIINGRRDGGGGELMTFQLVKKLLSPVGVTGEGG